MIASLDALAPAFRPLAVEFLARVVEANLCIKIINTRRSHAEQAALLASGHSWIAHSKHEDGLALDVCPYAIFALHGADRLQWDLADPVWATLATLGERVGLVAGYRWRQRDAGHFEMPTIPPTVRT